MKKMNRGGYLLNARQIEVKTSIDPCKYLIPSNKVCTVHHPYIRRHLYVYVCVYMMKDAREYVCMYYVCNVM